MAVDIDASDKPLIKIEEDRLDRKYLVKALCLYLIEPDQNESWRVALLGPWGSGKTSVCNWFRQKAKDKGHIVVQYSSCSAKTEAELHYALFEKIGGALESKGIKVGKNKRLFKKLDKPLSRLSALLKGVPYHSGIDAVSNLVRHLSLLSKEDVEKLIKNVPDGQKIIVIIDDLDRVEKSLIPRFLLFLRDLMEVEGISFLLPFDDEIIAHALREYSTNSDPDSREYGESFLEKIIDYSVFIPTTSKKQYFDFFRDVLKSSCPFVALDEEAQSLQDVLPPNPRKIKRLARQLKAYGQEAQRHRPSNDRSSGEIDWHAVTLVELLRAESYQFTEWFFLDFWVRPPPSPDILLRKMQREPKEGSRKQKEHSNEWIENTLASLNISNAKKTRILALCDNIEKVSRWKRDSFSDAFNLTRKSEKLTWGEFDAIWHCWLAKKDFKEVIDLLKGYVEQSSLIMPAMVHEFINTLSYAYRLLLSVASDGYNLGEHEKVMDEAQQVLSLLDKILDEGHNIEGLTKKDIFDFDHFKVFWDSFKGWVHFDINPADKDTRVCEEKLLKKWLKEAQAIGVSSPFRAFLEDYTKYGRSGLLDAGRKGRDLCVRLLQHLDSLPLVISPLVASPLAEKVINAFRKPGGIKQILTSKEQENSLIRGEVLNPRSALWLDGDNNAPGFTVLLEAEKNHVVQTNAFWFLAFIEGVLQGEKHLFHEEDVKRIFQAPQVIIALWNACIAQEAQFRVLSHLRNIRQLCIKGGKCQDITKSTIEEKALIVPEWLKKGAKQAT